MSQLDYSAHLRDEGKNVPEESIELWPGLAPGSEQWTHEELTTTDAVTGGPRIWNVVTPSITPFLPDPTLANGTAVIVAPGGGFRFLGQDYEGTDLAEWFTARGVTAFVLKYRLEYMGATADEVQKNMQEWMMALFTRKVQVTPPERIAEGVVELAFDDGAQAVRTVRERASEWSIDPDKLGFIGFSAGAFVTTSVAVADDRSARPNFVAPIYGGHAVGPVDADAPPLFCAVSREDGLLLEACVDTFRAWTAGGASAELHVYAKGPHGFGMNKLGLPVDSWTDRLADWMQSLGYLP
jgi:acetyl esterase/lipase